MLRASVAFFVKTICRGSSAPISAATASRASRTVRPAAMERRWPERPGDPPLSRRNLSIAALVVSGFGQEVAALSK
jgi:hypothetical protein